MSHKDDKTLLSLVYAMPDIVYKIDREGRFTFLSDSICKLDYEPKELMGQHFSVILHAEDIELVQSSSVFPGLTGSVTGNGKAPKVFDERRTGKRLTKNLKVRLVPKKGKKGITPVGELNSIGIYEPGSDGKKAYAGTIGIIRDITEAAGSQKALYLAEKFYRTLIDNSTDILAILSADGTILYISNSVVNTLGYNPIDVIGENIFDQTHPDDAGLVSDILAARQRTDVRFIEHRIRHENGNWVVLETHPNHIYDDLKEIVSVVLYAHDITERKHADQEIRKNLDEKELLLREVHHRVKNNLQLITSLINLQSMNVSDHKMVEMLKNLQNRIIAMSLIHDKLYKSDNLSEIDFSAYLKSLIGELSKSYDEVSSGIRIQTAIDGIRLSIDKAIPCGLIVNELITNAFKYAFPVPKSGAVIGISFAPADKGTLKLAVHDNGIGIPDDVDVRMTETLGLTIVNILTEKQLKGQIDFNRNGGTRVSISFPR